VKSGQVAPPQQAPALSEGADDASKLNKPTRNEEKSVQENQSLESGQPTKQEKKITKRERKQKVSQPETPTADDKSAEQRIDQDEGARSSEEPAGTESLTPEENALREELETIIKKHEKGVFAVGEALFKINQKRLYRSSHATFKAYCKEVWDMSKPHAYRTMEAFRLMISMVSNGDTVLPTTESQTRILSKIPANKRKEVMIAAKAKADGGRVTAGHINQSLKELQTEIPVQTETGDGATTGDENDPENVVEFPPNVPISMDQIREWTESVYENLKANKKQEETLQLVEEILMALKFLIPQNQNSEVA
jgi:hypothetical protein